MAFYFLLYENTRLRLAVFQTLSIRCKKSGENARLAGYAT
jgi:hypothetical protein